MEHYNTFHASEARKRKVVMISLNGKRTEFNSIKEAAKETGLHEPCICRCCKGEQYMTGGFRFSYVIKPEISVRYLNLLDAAKMCHISPTALRYKAKELGIDRVRTKGRRLFFKETDIKLAISKDLFRDRRKERKSILIEL